MNSTPLSRRHFLGGNSIAQTAARLTSQQCLDRTETLLRRTSSFAEPPTPATLTKPQAAIDKADEKIRAYMLKQGLTYRQAYEQLLAAGELDFNPEKAIAKPTPREFSEKAHEGRPMGFSEQSARDHALISQCARDWNCGYAEAARSLELQGAIGY
jgi:hypothetical protein